MLDGDAGTDRVQVNGAPAGTGDAFTLNAAGTRVALARSNFGPFSLDVGGAESLAVAGSGSPDTLTSGDLTGVSDLSEVAFHGLDGADTMYFTSGGPVAGLMRGGNGGDTLAVNGVPGAGAESFTVAPATQGRFSVARTAPSAASASADGTENVVVDGDDGSHSLTIGAMTGVPKLTSASLRGSSLDDVFNVIPSTTVTTDVQAERAPTRCFSTWDACS